MLMEIIDTPDVRKVNHFKSHSLILDKRSDIKWAYKMFG